jgi:hypothetical protein
VFDVLQDALEALDVVHETRARERERWRGSTAVILRALPLCPGEYTKTPIVRDGTVIGHSGHFAGCGKVATWGLLGEACDEHRATKMLELPYAAELRALLALLEAK